MHGSLRFLSREVIFAGVLSENPGKYTHKLYIAGNLSSMNIFAANSVRVYFFTLLSPKPQLPHKLPALKMAIRGHSGLHILGTVEGRQITMLHNNVGLISTGSEYSDRFRPLSFDV